jgi:hypothetical protein
LFCWVCVFGVFGGFWFCWVSVLEGFRCMPGVELFGCCS